MNGEELTAIAVRLSGLPPRKNRRGGHGALRWLADTLDVHPSTISRWVRGPDHNGTRIPTWAVASIKALCEMDREMRDLDERS